MTTPRTKRVPVSRSLLGLTIAYRMPTAFGLQTGTVEKVTSAADGALRVQFEDGRTVTFDSGTYVMRVAS